jgi:hypothetical protein
VSPKFVLFPVHFTFSQKDPICIRREANFEIMRSSVARAPWSSKNEDLKLHVSQIQSSATRQSSISFSATDHDTVRKLLLFDPSTLSIVRKTLILYATSTMGSWMQTFLLLAATLLVTKTKTTTASPGAGLNVLSAPPISLKHGLNKFARVRWEKAVKLAELEQQVEDYNAEWIATSSSTAQAVRHRRLICLPLDDGFDPPMGVFSHGHVQTGDKMSLPKVFWQAVTENNAEVPWLYRVRRIDGVTGERVDYKEDEATASTKISPHKPMRLDLDQVVGGPLDYRAPSNYIFVPWWMMRALGLKPRDIVQVDLIESVPSGSLAKLRPHSSQFAKDISNPQAVLETELRHYSALTQGSTIAFDYNKQRYWFDVVETRSAPRGEKQPMIKVQDCDIATDFLPAKDTLKKKPKRKEEDEL